MADVEPISAAAYGASDWWTASGKGIRPPMLNVHGLPIVEANSENGRAHPIARHAEYRRRGDRIAVPFAAAR
jgi:hypothetical protein